MSTRRALSIAAIITACLLALSACKSNQTQQQSSSMPSSGGASGGGPAMPSSSPPGGSSGGAGSSGGSTASLPGGSNSPAGGSMPSSGGPGGLPSGGGIPGSSMPSGPSGGSQGSQPVGSSGGESGNSSSGGGFEPAGGGSRSGNPGDQAPGTPGDRNGDGIPDTAQPGSQSDDVDFSESSGGGVQSREEQVATLDEELEGSMRDYDGRILEERAGVMGRPGEDNAEEQLEDFDRSVAYYDEAEEGELSEDVSTAENQSPPPARGQGQGSGSGAPGGIPSKVGSRDVSTPPDDIPCGNNDDVVARQIREAAMQEQDPDLREALWEEYRKYKEQAGQGKSC